MAKFKTRARTLDMLGRQQIAGLPTAISELFKNAHDAYADTVEVDYFPKNKLLILRDDGIGMTLDEFEQRWLVLGTESKLGAGVGITPTRTDPDKDPRPIMGEKGIGRLAIALLGPQVLILTRAKINNNSDNLVAAFIHWGLFECPGLDIDQIDIPIRVFPGGSLPERIDIEQMIDSVKENVSELKSLFPNELEKRILKELSEFKLNLSDIEKFLRQVKAENVSQSPILTEDGHGTHFYITPANDVITSEIDIDLADKGISRLKRFLLGFNNTMLPNSKRPRINTAFRYWKDNRNPVDLISEREFFTPDDFQTADHRIKGEFDKFGNFTGTVEVYGELNSYVLSWRSENKTTDCGSFGINFAYLPGRRTDSRLPQEEYERIAVKCERIGGLYIYRDGIRILPYGDSDFDWLEVEKRRSKGAGYYYFSYRNMIGAIDISQSENKDLIEKAGREGFQENKGYREFRDILINFLIKVADKYFRKDSEHFQKREEMRRQEKAKREGEKLRREQRRKLANSLDKFFTQTQTNDLEKARQELLESLIKNLNAATQQLYPDDIKSSLNQSEVQARNRVNEIRSRIKVEIPPGVGLTDELEHDWLAYALEIDRLEKEYFQPLEGEIYERILEANRRAELEIDTKQRIERLINETTSESKTKISSEENAIRNEIDRIEKNVNSLLNDTRSDWNRIITGTEEKLRQLISNSSTMSNMEDQRHQLEREIIVKTDAVLDKLRRIRDQLIRIQWFQDEEGLLFGESEISAALETELLSIRNQFDTNLELAQLGMAIEVINHEFNQNVRNIRINLQGLKRWADLNPQLMPQYKDIRTSFEHLDAYLSLLTPLSRRLYRQATEITGIGIEEFLSNLFNDSLKKSGINLKVSKAFRDGKIFGYPSTFYPVFINLMDNSIYWLSIKQNSPREIYLDRQGDFFIFSDNGPGITSRDKDKIFEYGFSTKPSGRGLGLYIAKRVLEKEGFTLELINSPTGRGATFKIGPKN